MNKHLIHILLALHVVPPAAFALSSEQDDFKLSRQKRIGIEYIANNSDLKKNIIAKKKTKSNRLNEIESRPKGKPISKQLTKSTTIKRQPLRKQSVTDDEEEGSEE